MHRYKYIVFVLLAVLLSGCEDIIDVDLNEAHPRIVIEAEINSQSNYQQFRVSRTVPFSSDMSYEPISGAQVLVYDNRNPEGVELVEAVPGVYVTAFLRGVSGRTYTLNVTVDGTTYTAESTMPALVPIDSVSSSSGEFLGVSRKALHVHFQDPPDQQNFFRYKMSVNDEDFKNIGVFSDKFNNGRYITHDLMDMDIDLESGDEVVILRNQIDENAYRYWFGIMMLNPGAAAPSNPPSNISGGALGYFSAQTAVELRMVISDEPAD